LEVNEHLRQQVEEKGSLALSLGAQMEACESRYKKLLDRVHDLERQVATAESTDDGLKEVRAFRFQQLRAELGYKEFSFLVLLVLRSSATLFGCCFDVFVRPCTRD
jgi:hypothetical protein